MHSPDNEEGKKVGKCIKKVLFNTIAANDPHGQEDDQADKGCGNIPLTTKYELGTSQFPGFCPVISFRFFHLIKLLYLRVKFYMRQNNKWITNYLYYVDGGEL